MNYNDFPILSNDEYKFLNEQYSLNPSFDRKTYLFKICTELLSCINICVGLNGRFNSKICYTISDSKQVLEKILNNLTSTFNISMSSQKEISNFNLFTFLKKIINTVSLITSLTNFEQKEYYKTMLTKSTNELLKILENIITALENSNLHFFTHM